MLRARDRLREEFNQPYFELLKELKQTFKRLRARITTGTLHPHQLDLLPGDRMALLP